MENKEQISEEKNDFNNSKKLLSIVYLIIAISMCIGFYYYFNQNNSNVSNTWSQTNIETWTHIETWTNSEPENDMLNKVKSNTWIESTQTNSLNPTNINTNTNDNLSNKNTPSTNSWLQSSWTIDWSWSKTKTEKDDTKAVINDIMKEFEELFESIEENGTWSNQ